MSKKDILYISVGLIVTFIVVFGLSLIGGAGAVQSIGTTALPKNQQKSSNLSFNEKLNYKWNSLFFDKWVHYDEYVAQDVMVPIERDYPVVYINNKKHATAFLSDIQNSEGYVERIDVTNGKILGVEDLGWKLSVPNFSVFTDPSLGIAYVIGYKQDPVMKHVYYLSVIGYNLEQEKILWVWKSPPSFVSNVWMFHFNAFIINGKGLALTLSTATDIDRAKKKVTTLQTTYFINYNGICTRSTNIYSAGSTCPCAYKLLFVKNNKAYFLIKLKNGTLSTSIYDIDNNKVIGYIDTIVPDSNELSLFNFFVLPTSYPFVNNTNTTYCIALNHTKHVYQLLRIDMDNNKIIFTPIGSVPSGSKDNLLYCGFQTDKLIVVRTIGFLYKITNVYVFSKQNNTLLWHKEIDSVSDKHNVSYYDDIGMQTLLNGNIVLVYDNNVYVVDGYNGKTLSRSSFVIDTAYNKVSIKVSGIFKNGFLTFETLYPIDKNSTSKTYLSIWEKR